jgi:hypothetical protein
MSERVISDPTVAGWELNPDTGYWMWAAGSDGSGGSIQDGDTEGQITTWDGDEWTPEGAVVVSGGNVAIGTDTPLYTSADRTALTVNGTSSANLVFGHSDVAKHYLLSDASGLTVGTEGNANVVIDADGAVTLSHPANLKGRRASGNLPLTLIGYEEGTDNVELIASAGWAIKDGAKDTLFSIDADTGSVNITGRLFINGEEVTAGGGASLWTDNGDGTISSAKTAKAPDFVTT